MNPSRWLSSLALTVLALWMTMVFAAALSAGVTFTVLPEMQPSIPGYEALDAATQARMIAGRTTEPLFLIADRAQIILCPLLVILLALQYRTGFGGSRLARRRADWIRMLAVGLATLTFLIRWGLVTAPMNAALITYREHALAGDTDAAMASLATFEQWHHLAEPLWGLTGLALLIAIIATGATLTPGTDRSSQRPRASTS